MVQLEVLEVEALENVTELDVGLGIDDIAVRDIYLKVYHEMPQNLFQMILKLWGW